MDYKLNIKGMVIDGSFIYDENLGFYFITKPDFYSLDFSGDTDIEINDGAISLKDGDNYNFYKINYQEKYVYVIGKKNKEPVDVEYKKLEELDEDFNSNFVLNILAEIKTLPTGDFICSDVTDYINVIEAIDKKYSNFDHFYRGHYYYKYQLIPSLYRRAKYYNNEDLMYLEFKTKFYSQLSNKRYIDILTNMQHYNMPTRLLDTTSNPLVALFMAVDRPIGFKNKGPAIGEVVLMNEEKKHVKYVGSNAVVILSSLAVLETQYKQELYEKIIEAQEKNDPSIYKESIAYKRFVAEVHNELPYFDESFFNPKVLLKPRHVKVGMMNERIIAQSGNFILFGLCNYNTGEYMPLKTVAKERIFIVNKEKILNQLDMLNINSASMYPDMDHTASAIKKRFE